MSQKKGHKNEMVLAPSDAADLLRRLADQLEAGGVEIGEVMVENDGPVKIKQSIKTKSDKVSFKLKMKYETALTPELNGALGELLEEEPEESEEAVPVEEDKSEAGVEPEEPKSADTDEAAEMKKDAEKPKRAKSRDKTKDKKPSYKSMKKSMSKSYKSIKKTLAEEMAPSLEEVNGFAADCQFMTSFSGKGDPNYEDFLHHVDDLKAAAEAGDVKALARAMAEITAMRKSCHSKFK